MKNRSKYIVKCILCVFFIIALAVLPVVVWKLVEPAVTESIQPISITVGTGEIDAYFDGIGNIVLWFSLAIGALTLLLLLIEETGSRALTTHPVLCTVFTLIRIAVLGVGLGLLIFICATTDGLDPTRYSIARSALSFMPAIVFGIFGLIQLLLGIICLCASSHSKSMLTVSQEKVNETMKNNNV